MVPASGGGVWAGAATAIQSRTRRLVRAFIGPFIFKIYFLGGPPGAGALTGALVVLAGAFVPGLELNKPVILLHIDGAAGALVAETLGPLNAAEMDFGAVGEPGARGAVTAMGLEPDAGTAGVLATAFLG